MDSMYTFNLAPFTKTVSSLCFILGFSENIWNGSRIFQEQVRGNTIVPSFVGVLSVSACRALLVIT